MPHVGFLTACALLLLALLPRSVAAQYVDPGAGSVLLQGLLAVAGAVLLTVGIYWRATVGFFRRRRHNPDRDPTGPSDA